MAGRLEIMLSIIVPVHNEANRIGHTLEEYGQYFPGFSGGQFEIIVVTNGCRDNTVDIVGEYSRKYDFIKMHSIMGKGKGRAIKAGIILGKGDLLAFTDADGATEASQLAKVIKALG